MSCCTLRTFENFNVKRCHKYCTAVWRSLTCGTPLCEAPLPSNIQTLSVLAAQPVVVNLLRELSMICSGGLSHSLLFSMLWARNSQQNAVTSIPEARKRAAIALRNIKYRNVMRANSCRFASRQHFSLPGFLEKMDWRRWQIKVSGVWVHRGGWAGCWAPTIGASAATARWYTNIVVVASYRCRLAARLSPARRRQTVVDTDSADPDYLDRCLVAMATASLSSSSSSDQIRFLRSAVRRRITTGMHNLPPCARPAGRYLLAQYRHASWYWAIGIIFNIYTDTATLFFSALGGKEGCGYVIGWRYRISDVTCDAKEWCVEGRHVSSGHWITHSHVTPLAVRGWRESSRGSRHEELNSQWCNAGSSAMKAGIVKMLRTRQDAD